MKSKVFERTIPLRTLFKLCVVSADRLARAKGDHVGRTVVSKTPLLF